MVSLVHAPLLILDAANKPHINLSWGMDNMDTLQAMKNQNMNMKNGIAVMANDDVQYNSSRRNKDKVKLLPGVY